MDGNCETTSFHVKILNHPIEQPFINGCFKFPGSNCFFFVAPVVVFSREIRDLAPSSRELFGQIFMDF